MSDNSHAISNAKAWLASIVEETTALAEADAGDTIECGQCEGTGEVPTMAAMQSDDSEETEMCPVCDGSGEIDREGDSAEEIRERIQEGPLSVQVRGGWHTPGDPEGRKPEEYELLLSTGGPTLRLIGDLDEYGEPDTPKIQWQDWGTPWTTYYTTDKEDAALLAYARCFYYGEG